MKRTLFYGKEYPYSVIKLVDYPCDIVISCDKHLSTDNLTFRVFEKETGTAARFIAETPVDPLGPVFQTVVSINKIPKKGNKLWESYIDRK